MGPQVTWPKSLFWAQCDNVTPFTESYIAKVKALEILSTCWPHQSAKQSFDTHFNTQCDLLAKCIQNKQHYFIITNFISCTFSLLAATTYSMFHGYQQVLGVANSLSRTLMNKNRNLPSLTERRFESSINQIKAALRTNNLGLAKFSLQ